MSNTKASKNIVSSPAKSRSPLKVPTVAKSDVPKKPSLSQPKPKAAVKSMSSVASSKKQPSAKSSVSNSVDNGAVIYPKNATGSDAVWDKFVLSDPFAKTLLEPGSYLGVKVPIGGNQMSTGTYSQVIRFPIDTSGEGSGAVVVGIVRDQSGDFMGGWNPTKTPFVDPTGTHSTPVIGVRTNSANTDITAFFPDGISVATGPYAIHPTYDLTTYGAKQSRIVSAGLTVLPTMSDLDNSGVFTAALANYDFFWSRNSDEIGLADVQALPGSMVSPVNKGPIHMTWRPFDDSTSEFWPYLETSSGVPTPELVESRQGNAFIVAVNGAKASLSEAFLCSLVINYEVLFNENVPAAVGGTFGLNDPIGYAEVTSRVTGINPIGLGEGSTNMAFNDFDLSANPNAPSLHSIAMITGKVSKGFGGALLPHPYPFQLGKKGGKSFIRKLATTGSMFARLAKTVLPMAKTALSVM